MFVVPVGSDANLHHRPVATMVIVAVFAVITVAVWIAHPLVIAAGIPGLIASRSGDSASAAADAHAEEAERLGHPTAASLADELELVPPLTPRSEPARKLATLSLAQARDKGWIDEAAFTDLSKRLAEAPTLSPEAALYARFDLDLDAHPFMAEDDIKLVRAHINQELDDHRIDAAQAEQLHRRLAQVRMVQEAYPHIYARIDPKGHRPLSTEEVEQIGNSIDYNAHEGNLLAAEATELHALLAARGSASTAVAERSVDSIAEVPWYLAPVGAWSNPLRWVLAICVHPRWSDALAGLAFTWSFGLVVEGMVGTRRFLMLFGGAVGLACLWTQFTGLFAPALLIHAGSSEVRACLAGLLVLWVPTNVISYVRWLVVPIGAFDIAIWKVVATSTVIGLLGGIFSGFPLPVAIFGQILFPAAGLLVGYLTLRAGWVPSGTWDLPFLWHTRRMSAAERSAYQRERGWEVDAAAAEPAPTTTKRVAAAGIISASKPAVAKTPKPPAVKPAAPPPTPVVASAPAGPDPLLVELESEIRASLAAGQLDVAHGLWKATRSSAPAWVPALPLLYELLKGLYGAKREGDAQAVAEDIVKFHPARARDARLVLANRALAARKPGTARGYLDGITPAETTPQTTAQVERLRAKIAELEAQGVLEVEFV